MNNMNSLQNNTNQPSKGQSFSQKPVEVIPSLSNKKIDKTNSDQNGQNRLHSHSNLLIAKLNQADRSPEPSNTNNANIINTASEQVEKKSNQAKQQQLDNLGNQKRQAKFVIQGSENSKNTSRMKTRNQPNHFAQTQVLQGKLHSEGQTRIKIGISSQSPARLLQNNGSGHNTPKAQPSGNQRNQTTDSNPASGSVPQEQINVQKPRLNIVKTMQKQAPASSTNHGGPSSSIVVSVDKEETREVSQSSTNNAAPISAGGLVYLKKPSNFRNVKANATYTNGQHEGLTQLLKNVNQKAQASSGTTVQQQPQQPTQASGTNAQTTNNAQFKRTRVFLVKTDKDQLTVQNSSVGQNQKAQNELSTQNLSQRQTHQNQNRQGQRQTVTQTQSEEPINNRGKFAIKETTQPTQEDYEPAKINQEQPQPLFLQDHNNRRRLQAMVQNQQSSQVPDARHNPQMPNQPSSAANLTQSQNQQDHEPNSASDGKSAVGGSLSIPSHTSQQRLRTINKKLITFSQSQTTENLQNSNTSRLNETSATSNIEARKDVTQLLQSAKLSTHGNQTLQLSKGGLSKLILQKVGQVVGTQSSAQTTDSRLQQQYQGIIGLAAPNTLQTNITTSEGGQNQQSQQSLLQSARSQQHNQKAGALVNDSEIKLTVIKNSGTGNGGSRKTLGNSNQLGYRRHQLIQQQNIAQDIQINNASTNFLTQNPPASDKLSTPKNQPHQNIIQEDKSPRNSQAMAKAQKQLKSQVQQMKQKRSNEQMRQESYVNNKDDLAKIFYQKPANNLQGFEEGSTPAKTAKLITPIKVGSAQETQQQMETEGNGSSHKRQAAVLTIAKKQVSIDKSASNSKERLNIFKIKKASEQLVSANHPQLKRQQVQLQGSDHQGGASGNNTVHQSLQQQVPSIGKRRPLIIYKNNFVNGTNQKEENGPSQKSVRNDPVQQQSSRSPSQSKKPQLILPSHKLPDQYQPMGSAREGSRDREGKGVIGLQQQYNHGSYDRLLSHNNPLQQPFVTQKMAGVDFNKTQYINKNVIRGDSSANGVSGTMPSFAINGASQASPRSITLKSTNNPSSSGTNPNNQNANDSKLIRINKTKKKLESARRSRIQQLQDTTIARDIAGSGLIQATDQILAMTKGCHTTKHDSTRGKVQLLEPATFQTKTIQQLPMFLQKSTKGMTPSFNGGTTVNGVSSTNTNQQKPITNSDMPPSMNRIKDLGKGSGVSGLRLGLNNLNAIHLAAPQPPLTTRVAYQPADKLITVSSVSSKPLKRGQIFRKQTQQKSQDSLGFNCDSQQPSQVNQYHQGSCNIGTTIKDQSQSSTQRVPSNGLQNPNQTQQSSLKVLQNISSHGGSGSIVVGEGVVEKTAKQMPPREDKASKSAINLHQIDTNGQSSNGLHQEIKQGVAVGKKSLERTEGTRELPQIEEDESGPLSNRQPNHQETNEPLKNTFFNNTSEVNLHPFCQENSQKQGPQLVNNNFGATTGTGGVINIDKSGAMANLLDNTGDTSRKATSYERAYCNSSVTNVRAAIGSTFSFKSHETPAGGVSGEIPKFPMAPQVCLTYYSNFLTEYERKEILDYPLIYFIGAPTAQKIVGSAHLECNFGYDDVTGDYKIVNNDHIGYRYEVISFLGKGSFGTALKCRDHKTGQDIAIKLVKNKQKYYYQAGVELKILQFLRQNDPDDIMNVIHLNDYVVFRRHLCIGFELLSMNLFEFLKINDFCGFDHNLVRRFAIQLLYALKYLKNFQIIHCDLKPENILLKEPNKSGIKIIDFGSSTFVDERVYTYIQSRFYRAPEIMLGIPYNTAIDMWSFGCIVAELYIGYPIFPGESEQDQLSRIMEMIGTPSREVMLQSQRKMRFFQHNPENPQVLEPFMTKNSRGKLRRPMGKPLQLVIGEEDPDFTDFVVKCLEMDPAKRLTPEEALKHIWVLKGLPPQVLIHHQRMHGIATPELPQSIQVIINKFLVEQQQTQQTNMQIQAQQILLQQQQQQQQFQNNVNLINDISQDGGFFTSSSSSDGRIQYQAPSSKPNLAATAQAPRLRIMTQQQAEGVPPPPVAQIYPGSTRVRPMQGMNAATITTMLPSEAFSDQQQQQQDNSKLLPNQQQQQYQQQQSKPIASRQKVNFFSDEKQTTNPKIDFYS